MGIANNKKWTINEHFHLLHFKPLLQMSKLDFLKRINLKTKLINLVYLCKRLHFLMVKIKLSVVCVLGGIDVEMPCRISDLYAQVRNIQYIPVFLSRCNIINNQERFFLFFIFVVALRFSLGSFTLPVLPAILFLSSMRKRLLGLLFK